MGKKKRSSSYFNDMTDDEWEAYVGRWDDEYPSYTQRRGGYMYSFSSRHDVSKIADEIFGGKYWSNTQEADS